MYVSTYMYVYNSGASVAKRHARRQHEQGDDGKRA